MSEAILVHSEHILDMVIIPSRNNEFVHHGKYV